MVSRIQLTRLPLLSLLLSFLLASLLLLACGPAAAGVVTFDNLGGGDGLWSNDSNWDTAAAPGADDQAVIDAAALIQGGPSATQEEFTVSAAVVSSGQTLTVNGDLNVVDTGAGTPDVENLVVKGTLDLFRTDAAHERADVIVDKRLIIDADPGTSALVNPQGGSNRSGRIDVSGLTEIGLATAVTDSATLLATGRGDARLFGGLTMGQAGKVELRGNGAVDVEIHGDVTRGDGVGGDVAVKDRADLRLWGVATTRQIDDLQWGDATEGTGSNARSGDLHFDVTQAGLQKLEATTATLSSRTNRNYSRLNLRISSVADTSWNQPGTAEWVPGQAADWTRGAPDGGAISPGASYTVLEAGTLTDNDSSLFQLQQNGSNTTDWTMTVTPGAGGTVVVDYVGAAAIPFPATPAIVDNGATVQWKQSTALLIDDAATGSEHAGKLTIDGGSVLEVIGDGATAGSGDLFFGADMEVFSGTLDVAGDLRGVNPTATGANGGRLDVDGALTVGGDVSIARLRLAQEAGTSSSYTTPAGQQVNLNNNLALANGAGATSTFTIDGAGTLVTIANQLNVAQYDDSGPGTLALKGGTLDLTGGAVNTGPNTTINWTGGVLKDVATFDGSLSQLSTDAASLLRIGASPGVMTITDPDELSLADYLLGGGGNGATLEIELLDQLSEAGIGYDLLSVEGTATLAGTVLVQDASAGAIDPGMAWTWNVIEADEIVLDRPLAEIVTLPGPGFFAQVIDDFQGGPTDVLQISTIPEPSTFLMLGTLAALGGLLLAFSRRRR